MIFVNRCQHSLLLDQRVTQHVSSRRRRRRRLGLLSRVRDQTRSSGLTGWSLEPVTKEEKVTLTDVSSSVP